MGRKFSALRAFLEAMTGDTEPDVCANPLCPGCLGHRGQTDEEVAQSLRDVFSLLTVTELVEVCSKYHAMLADIYQDGEPEVGGWLREAQEKLRQSNQMFRLATEADWHKKQ